MSAIDLSPLVPLIKELGFAGIAIYALVVMNNLTTTLKTVEVTLARVCEKIEG